MSIHLRRQWLREGTFAFTCALLAVLFTLFVDYRFGIDDHWGLLASIRRFFDSSFAPADAYVDSYDGPSIRRYFIAFMAPLAWTIGYSPAFWLVQVTAIALILYASGRLGRSIVPGFALANYVPLLPVLLLQGIHYGGNERIVEMGLVPRELSFAVALLGIALLCENRYRLSLFFFASATLFHPQVGFLVGLLSYTAHGASSVMQRYSLASFAPAAASLIALAACTAVAWGMLAFETIHLSSERYADIVTKIRNPHHFLVGAPWRRSDLSFLCFGVVLLAFSLSRFERVNRQTLRLLTFAALAAMVMMAAGYVLTEIHVTRLGASLQTPRLVSLLNWIALSLAAAAVCIVFRRDAWLKQRGMSLFTLLALFPILVSFKPIPPLSIERLNFKAQTPLLERHVLRLGPWRKDLPEMAVGVALKTPRDSLILVPPDWYPLRACTGRAVYSLFKTFPYGAGYTKIWYDQLDDLFQLSKRGERGLYLERVFMKEYENFTLRDLANVKENHGVTHAVLRKANIEGARSLHETERYALVSLNSSDEAAMPDPSLETVSFAGPPLDCKF